MNYGQAKNAQQDQESDGNTVWKAFPDSKRLREILKDRLRVFDTEDAGAPGCNEEWLRPVTDGKIAQDG